MPLTAASRTTLQMLREKSRPPIDQSKASPSRNVQINQIIDQSMEIAAEDAEDAMKGVF